MNELTKLIKEDMKPALGVTEPGAIAFAAATAREHLAGDAEKLEMTLNSGMYKNAYTCGIPGSTLLGNEYAAALGVIMADPSKGLLCLEGLSDEDQSKADEMVRQGRVHVNMCEVTSRIYIEAKASNKDHSSRVIIRDSHTNIVEIKEDDVVVLREKESTADTDGSEHNSPLIHKYTLRDLYEYVCAVPAEEIEFISEAFRMNMELFEEGLENERTTFSKALLDSNGGKVFSDDPQSTASLLCNTAIEARVIGLGRPAMSITGSGAHGIIATLPLYAYAKVCGVSNELLLRATALSYLICMYIKEYSGKLSAFCGCAIAAGTGMACGLVLMKGGSTGDMGRTINNMASSITGMICDGGNHGCTMKGIVAVDAAFRSVDFAMKGICIESVHGINGRTPEETMRNMGMIASPGMTGTEKTIVELLQDKSCK